MEVAAAAKFGRTDDLGAPIRILDPAQACEWPTAGDARMAALVERLRTAQSSIGLAVGLASIALLIVGLIGMAFLFRLLKGWPAWVPIAFVAAGWWASARPVSRLRVRSAAAQVARLILEEGLCPGCGYNFCGLDRDRDSIIRCPECGAGWRVDRIRRVQPFAPGLPLGPSHALILVGGSSNSLTGLDHRRQRVRVVHPRLRRELAAASDIEIKRRLKLARAAISQRSRFVQWSVSIVIVACAVTLTGVNLARGGIDPADLVIQMIVVWTLTALSVWAVFRHYCPSMQVVQDAMLEQHLCPSCAGPVDPDSVEADHKHVCPQCFAAWRMPVPPDNP